MRYSATHLFLTILIAFTLAGFGKAKKCDLFAYEIHPQNAAQVVTLCIS